MFMWHIRKVDLTLVTDLTLLCWVRREEIVIDNDQLQHSDKRAPGLIWQSMQASDKSGIANVFKDFASYEQGQTNYVVFKMKVPEENGYGGESPSTMDCSQMMIGSPDNSFEFLEYQG